MTPAKVRQVLAIYRRKFEGLGIVPSNHPHTTLICSRTASLSHCFGMLDQIEGFIQEPESGKKDRMDKVNRWLGFVQGVLWAEGVYTLESLKNHNRKDAE